MPCSTVPTGSGAGEGSRLWWTTVGGPLSEPTILATIPVPLLEPLSLPLYLPLFLNLFLIAETCFCRVQC